MNPADEVEELRAQQAATSEILRIISRFPADVQPVLDAVVENAVQLCAAEDCEIRLVDGEVHRPAAHFGSIEPEKARAFAGKGPVGPAVKGRHTVHVLDVLDEHPGSQMALLGVRSALVVPLLRDRDAIGAIILRRLVVLPFSDRQIRLLETFAAQAVIAIENARLFNQLEARNREVTESLEQQTATAEILRVISSSPTDLQPVFDSILENATRLCGAHLGTLGLFDGEKYEYVAQCGGSPEFVQQLFRGRFIPEEGTNLRRMLVGQEVVHVPDRRAQARPGGVLTPFFNTGARTVLVVPMVKESKTVGGIIIYRPEVRLFTQQQIELVKTFADQAVIAIENVRLFKETKDALERLAEANRAKSRFLAAASHDLRQPVHALGLFVAQLQGARDPAVRERIVEKVEASTTAVSQLVEALLDISKLDQGTVEPQLSELALQPLLDRLEQAFSMSAQAKNLRFRVRPSALCVRSDPVLLERIVLNLVANAVRYTRHGGIVVAARRRGDRARIEVWDTGIGISPEEQQHIFEEFYQAAGAPDGAAKGLGLGLAIVDRLSRLLGLTVTLRSTPDRGSLFAVDVPVAAQQAPRAAPVGGPLEAGRIEGLRVLLIDDDAAAREAAEGLLIQWGCEVVSASSRTEALGLLSAYARPSVIISDYRLGPHERGTDVVKEIRLKLAAAIPAVIVSADSSATSFEAIAAEGLHLLRKPLKAAQLRVLLHHVVAEAAR
jgi:signal transduction histidine kinase